MDHIFLLTTHKSKSINEKRTNCGYKTGLQQTLCNCVCVCVSVYVCCVPHRVSEVLTDTLVMPPCLLNRAVHTHTPIHTRRSQKRPALRPLLKPRLPKRWFRQDPDQKTRRCNRPGNSSATAVMTCCAGSRLFF